MDEVIEILEELLENWEDEGTLGDESDVARDLTKVLNLLIKDISRDEY